MKSFNTKRIYFLQENEDCNVLNDKINMYSCAVV